MTDVAALLHRAQVLSRGLKLHAERNKLFRYFPDTDTPGFAARDKYQKQLEFFRRGKDTFARMFMASPGAGKTEPAGCEWAYHLRGWYPHWWDGHGYGRPIDIWISGKSFKTTRDIIQTKLLGKPGEEGSGIIPYDWIDHESIRRIQNGNGAIDNFRVKREDGSFSYVGFKCVEQGIAAYYGTEKDGLWYDEPHPADIFAQGVARTRNREGARVVYTVAPLEGNTETVRLFREESSPDRIVIQAGWRDAPHLTEEWQRQQLSVTPRHLHDAFINGNPTAGEGAVYTIPEADFVIDPFPIPQHFAWLFGFDGGYHNTAAGFLAYDRDKDTAYLVGDYKAGGTENGEPIDYTIHAARLKARSKVLSGFEMPGYGDAAAINQSDGKKVLDLYRNAGVNLHLADKSVSAGIDDVRSRLASGRLKVFRTCQKFLDEYRSYHYGDDQKPVKVDDHIMDAVRYGVRSLKHAKQRGQQNVTQIRTVGIRR